MINYSASIKISQLSELTGSNITMDDFVPIVDSGSMITERVSLRDLKLAIFATASIGADTNIIFQSGSALSASNNFRYDYVNQILHVTKSIVTPSLTGSVSGTASWAANVVSSSYAKTSSNTTMYPDIYDVNQKVGIRNAAPQYSLDINGQIGSSNTGYLNLADRIIIPGIMSNSPANMAFQTGDRGGTTLIGTNGTTLVSNTNYCTLAGVLAGSNTNMNSVTAIGLGAASSGPSTTINGAVILGVNSGTNSNLQTCTVIGPRDCGTGMTNITRSNFFGYCSGRNANTMDGNDFIGNYAGQFAENVYNTTCIGSSAGEYIQSASSCFFGGEAGSHSTGSHNIMIGNAAGGTDQGAGHCQSSQRINIGVYAGTAAAYAQDSVFVGYSAGSNATSASTSVFIGTLAGHAYSSSIDGYSNASSSVFIGYLAGSGRNSASISPSGPYHAMGPVNTPGSVFVGSGAGCFADSSSNSVFIGYLAGGFNLGAANCIFVGHRAGYDEIPLYDGGPYTINNLPNVSSSVGIDRWMPSSSMGHYNICIGDYSATAGYPDSICIGRGAVAFATRSLNIANTIYGVNINSTSSFDISGSILSNQYKTPASSCKIGIGMQPNITGAMLQISGALSKGSGTFLINHPDPSKVGYKLRHSFVESPTRGDNIYRFEITSSNDNSSIDIELPSYWKYLNENPQAWVSCKNGFGQGYGIVNDDLTLLTVNVNKSGIYNVLLIGTRKDPIAIDGWDNTGGIEYKE